MAEITRRHAALALAALLTGACAGGPRAGAPNGFEPSQFQTWSNEAPAYRLFPGDTVSVTVHTASELNRELIVGPDGRINPPLAGAVMVTGLTAPEAARAVADRYARVLRDPIVEVQPASFGAQQILVGGEVRTPGIYDMPSPRIGVIEAVTLAGGTTIRALRRDVVVLRRAENGGVMLRRVNLRDALSGGAGDAVPLTRHDIVFVPRTTIAEVNDFVELYVRNIIPLDQAFAFALADAAFNE